MRPSNTNQMYDRLNELGMINTDSRPQMFDLNELGIINTDSRPMSRFPNNKQPVIQQAHSNMLDDLSGATDSIINSSVNHSKAQENYFRNPYQEQAKQIHQQDFKYKEPTDERITFGFNIEPINANNVPHFNDNVPPHNDDDDEGQIEEFYNEMNDIKENVFNLLQTYQNNFQQEQKKEIKKKITNDANDIKTHYTNVMSRFQGRLDTSCITDMSKSDLSIMSNFNGKSMCKGNSKKEKELNMMMNLVEEFLKKFDHNKESHQQQQHNDKVYQQQQHKDKVYQQQQHNHKVQEQVSPSRNYVEKQPIETKKVIQEYLSPKLQEPVYKTAIQTPLQFQKTQSPEFRPPSVKKESEEVKTQYTYTIDDLMDKYKGTQVGSQKYTKKEIISYQQDSPKLYKSSSGLLHNTPTHTYKNIESEHNSEIDRILDQYRNRTPQQPQIIVKTQLQPQGYKNLQFVNKKQHVVLNFEAVKLYCTICDRIFEKDQYFAHLDACDQTNKKINYNDETILPQDDLNQLVFKVDKKISKIKENIQNTISEQVMPMTRNILMETLEGINSVLQSNDVNLIKKIIKKIEDQSESLTTDSHKSYNLYQYLKRIENLLEEKKYTLNQTQLLNEVSMMNRDDNSIWIDSKVQRPVVNQVPIMIRSGSLKQMDTIVQKKPEFQAQPQFVQKKTEFQPHPQIGQRKTEYQPQPQAQPQSQPQPATYQIKTHVNYDDNQVKGQFYKLVSNIKDSLPANHDGKSILITEIYQESKNQNIGQDEWEIFINKQLKI